MRVPDSILMNEYGEDELTWVCCPHQDILNPDIIYLLGTSRKNKNGINYYIAKATRDQLLNGHFNEILLYTDIGYTTSKNECLKKVEKK